MFRKALLRITVAALLVTPAALQSQTLAQSLSGCGTASPSRTIQANPSNYRSLLSGLLPGDRLLLAAGTYTKGLPLAGKNGQPNKCIVVEGPASGSPALFVGSSYFNTVSFKNSSYIAVRNLTLDGQGRLGDAVKAEAGSTYAHHILLENLKIYRHNNTVQTVGISTKCPAWNWVIRRNTIHTTGTGMYLGGSSGQFEFVNSLLEHNLVYATLGYNVQIKHQTKRNTSLGIPYSATTVIRHNVFSKDTGSLSGGEARPNLLLGHWPLSGAGSTDVYQVYGNLFYENPFEALMQGEGNIAFHDNLFVNRRGPAAVRIQRHNSSPRRIDAFHNTVLAKGTGISISGADAAYPQRVRANAVFATTPLSGGQQVGNLAGPFWSAGNHLNNVTAPLGGGLNLFPKAGKVTGTAVDTSFLSGLLDGNRDFNLQTRLSTFRGAYSDDGVNPGWLPKLAIKP